MKKVFICGVLALISASLSAQEVKTITIFDSPDHTEWHTVQYKDGGYTGHEYSHDLSLLDSARVRKSEIQVTRKDPQRDSLLQQRRDSIARREAYLRRTFWPAEF